MATFLVTVEYLEPTYRHDGHRYTFSFRVDAASASAAVDHALAEFHRMSALSSVGWVREIAALHIALERADQGRITAQPSST